MFRYRFNLDCDWIRDMLEDLAKPFRRAFALKSLPLVEAELGELENLQRPIMQAFRRSCSSLEETELAPDTVPAIRPGLAIKHAAASVGHYLSMALDFLVGLGLSRMAFRLSWEWSFGMGLLFVALAVLSRLVASVFLDRNRPARHVGLALRFGIAGWLVILLVFLGLYLVRTGLLSVAALGGLMPMLWLGFLVQSVAFGALAEAYSYPVQLYDRYRRLVVRKAELEAVRELLLAELPSDDGPVGAHIHPDARSGAKALGRGGLRPVRPRRRSARVTGALGLVALIGFQPLGAHSVHAGGAQAGSVTRLVLAPDESPGREDTDEFMRVRRVLGEGLEELVRALPGVEGIAVLRWSDASTVWAAGRVFALPHQPRALPLEASLAPFGYALSLRRAEDDVHDRTLRAPVLESVRRELLTSPSSPATQSCVTQLIMRALEAPASELWLIPSDLQDFRCPTVPRYVPGGAKVCIVVVPQREGTATRARLEARMVRLRRLFPELVLVQSWDIDSPSSLRSLAERAAARRADGDPR